ncbi:MAG TPA: D-glycero-beta-D-manno-heptose 1-phosphate adenylyltransferase [Blastocatellia bacterium]|nr:D-glycero-beta-D-manno-heptose 1-phosphate adenylyltransferase [Blastocatellia bacterium]
MGLIVDPETLVAIRQDLRQRGKRVVFTNGCFDLLHPGHVRLLAEAKHLGDVLIVALNSDRSVRQLKGAGRPILSQEERCEIVAALEMVDYVTTFDELTPRELIRKLLPDVLVKGGDWSIEEIVGREDVQAHGGQVLSLPFVPGYSTTRMIERIIRTFSAVSP